MEDVKKLSPEEIQAIEERLDGPFIDRSMGMTDKVKRCLDNATLERKVDVLTIVTIALLRLMLQVYGSHGPDISSHFEDEINRGMKDIVSKEI